MAGGPVILIGPPDYNLYLKMENIEDNFDVKNFRYRGNAFFFTYARTDVRKEIILAHVRDLFRAKFAAKTTEYVVATEAHADGFPHCHIFIHLDMSLDKSMSTSIFDYKDRHPNIQTARSCKGVIKYCSKKGDYLTNIEKKVERYLAEETKERDEIAKKLMAGKPLHEMVDEKPTLIFGYSRLKQDVQAYMLDKFKPEPLDRVCGVWIAGPGGAGKTTIARTRFGDYYDKGKNKWWDGYIGQPTVICEDVDASWGETNNPVYPYFKYWADKWPFIAETKCGTCRLRPSKFIVTSNFTLEELLTKWGIPQPEWYPYTRRFNSYWITSEDDWDESI